MLQDKTILLTGAGQGIGRVVARFCAQAGAKLILASRTLTDLESLKQDLSSVSSADHWPYVLDVSDYSAVQKLARDIAQKYGHIQGLVNCAGVLGPIGRLDTVDLAAFLQTIQINLMGTVYTSALLAPLLTSGSNIVNFSGGGATSPLMHYSAYAASKAAVVRLTENLALEYAPLGIQVNAVAPGFVATRIHAATLAAGAKATPEYLQSTQKQLSSGAVPPESAAELIVWLLSDQSQGVTGKLLSAPFDSWKDPVFIERLKTQKNLAVLRRIDAKYFFEKA